MMGAPNHTAWMMCHAAACRRRDRRRRLLGAAACRRRDRRRRLLGAAVCIAALLGLGVLL